jgi:phospholipid/cholesterol/gamma-HCH transport system ATP-binding protein
MATEPNPIAVRFVGIDKAFGDNVIYEGLSLDIRRGEILTILGGSGTGKSVLLKMMLGLIDPDAGQIAVDGVEVTGQDEDGLLPVRRKVGMVWQGGALFDSLTVFENLVYPLRERGVRDERQLAERARKVLEMVDLAGTEEMMPAELSGGMRKRISLARAIAPEPEILLYDEPTTGLDPINVRRIDDLILNLRRQLGMTSIVVTHDLQSAFAVSDRLAMLAQKRIVEVADKADFQRSAQPDVRAFLEAMRP